MRKTLLVLLFVAVFLMGAGAEQFWDLTSTTITTIQTVDMTLKGDLFFGTDNAYDIGSTTAGVKNAYLSGNARIKGGVTANTIMWGDTSTSAVSSDSFAVTITPAPTALTTGMSLYFKPDTVNTGACVLNVNSLGWKSIKTASGADPANNDLVTTTIGHLIYDGTNFLLMNPATTTD